MSQEIEFAASEIAEIIQDQRALQIRFAYVLVLAAGSLPSEAQKVPAVITITQAKFKTLPKKGIISDGELYGIPGKALNGRVPVNFRFDRGIELVLIDKDVEHSIHGKSIVVQIEASGLA